MYPTFLKESWSDFMRLVFNECCAGCEEILLKQEHLICTECRLALPKTDYHKNESNPLVQRFWGKTKLVHAWAYLQFVKGGRVQNMMHELKYGGLKEIGNLLGTWYGSELKADGFGQDIDLVIPVPIHAKRLAVRGYNQCDGIAEGMAEALGTTWNANGLSKITANQTQTKKSRFERWLNVEEVYFVPDPLLVQGKHVLVVDDVMTTGSTLVACAETLYKFGCKEVSVATLASAR
jgi:ComF family protein